jgi:hypothetical protein
LRNRPAVFYCGRKIFSGSQQGRCTVSAALDERRKYQIQLEVACAQFMLLSYAYCMLGRRDRLKTIYRYPVTFLAYGVDNIFLQRERETKVIIKGKAEKICE